MTTYNYGIYDKTAGAWLNEYTAYAQTKEELEADAFAPRVIFKTQDRAEELAYALTEMSGHDLVVRVIA